MPTSPSGVGLVLCALVLALGDCTGASTGAGKPEAGKPSARTSATPTNVAVSPTPTATRPFDVRVAHIDLDSLDNAAITGAAGIPPDGNAALPLVENARQVLARYLNRMFLSDAERFGTAPLNDLLTPGAVARLPADQRTGLGVLPLEAASTRPVGPVTADARVLLHGATVVHVLLSYEAQVEVEQVDGSPGRLVQRAGLLFVPTPAGARVEAVHATLEVLP